MTGFVKKYGKFIAAAVIISILIAGIPMFLNSFKMNQVNAVENENENRIAAEVSNVTGVKVEEVMKLRGTGLSWNEVLSKLKNSVYKKDSSERREDVLTNAGLGDDYVDKLLNEGYDKDKIMDVKLRVERVQYDLKEITDETDDTSIEVPKADDGLKADKDKEILEACKKINEKLDINTAVYLCVKLEKDFGSVDKVLDEYLLTLQLEINLEEYLIDQKDYEKQKAEKTALYTKTIVNLEKIEDLVLKKIQTKDKDKNKDDSSSGTNSKSSSLKADDKSKSPLPDNPIPEIKDNKPQNPANELMKEIQAIDPLKNGGK